MYSLISDRCFEKVRVNQSGETCPQLYDGDAVNQKGKVAVTIVTDEETI